MSIFNLGLKSLTVPRASSYCVIVKIISLNKDSLFFDTMYYRFIYWAFRFSFTHSLRSSSAPHKSVLKSSFVNKKARRQYVFFRFLLTYRFFFLTNSSGSSINSMLFQKFLLYLYKNVLGYVWPLSSVRLKLCTKAYAF